MIAAERSRPRISTAQWTVNRPRTTDSDAVSRSVQEALRKEFGPFASVLRVEASAGTVILSGRVPTYFAKQRAGHVAMESAAGFRLCDELIVG